MRKTTSSFLPILLFAHLALLGCSSNSSSKHDAGPAPGTGGVVGAGGARTGGSTGTKATGGSTGTTARGGSGGTAIPGTGGTSATGTGGAGHDGGGGASGPDGGDARTGIPDGPKDASDSAVDQPGAEASDAAMDGSPDRAQVDQSVAPDSRADDARDAPNEPISPCGACPLGLTCGGGGSSDRCGVTLTPRAHAFCSPDGWCFEKPRPQGNTLRSVYAISANDIWAVGEAGTILHFDGTDWSGTTGLFEAPGSYISVGIGDVIPGYNMITFQSVWANGPNDLWIAGSTGSGGTDSKSTEAALLIRGDGTHWERVVVPNATAKYFSGVWGLGPDDVWVVGYASKVAHHWDGVSWTTSSLPSNASYATGVWGVSATEVYLATQNGLFLFDGSAWSATSLTARLDGVTGSASIGPWAWGSTPWRLVGTTWVDMGSGSGLGPLWGASPSAIWKGLSYFDGATWTKLPGATNIQAVSGPKGTGAVGVGYRGVIADLSSTAATITYPDDPALAGTLLDIQASAADDVWVAERGTGPSGIGSVARAAHWNGTTWTGYDQSAAAEFSSIGVAAGGVVFAGSNVGPWALSGDTFIASPGALNISFKELWVAASDAAWALTGTNAAIYAFDGTTWQAVPHTLSSASIQWRDVWGLGRTDVWVAGSSGMTMHWDGTSWTPYATPSSTAKLSGIWAFDSTHAWTISEDNLVFAWDGTKWAASTTLSGGLGALHGCSLTELWASGGASATPDVHRFDGATWTRSNTGVAHFIGAPRLWCVAPGDVWLLSGDTLVHRRP